jgi:hypothetical protein
VRPAPQDLALAELEQVVGAGLGQQDDVAPGDQLGTRQQPADQGTQLVVGDAEGLAVALLEEDVWPDVVAQPVEVTRVQRQPPLVLLGGAGR